MFWLVFRYAIFALIAMVVNLAIQRLVIHALGENAGFVAAMAAGTGGGLLVKYMLDKKWIFYDTTKGIATHGRKFSLYTLMGVVTTAIFWGTETAFWLAWKTDAMREAGAVLGLTVGYVIKYHLDRRYVFEERQAGFDGW